MRRLCGGCGASVGDATASAKFGICDTTRVLKDNYSNNSFNFIVKCYLRKGHALVAMKDLGQAMAAFGKALEIDPNCQVNKRILNSFRQLYGIFCS